MRNPKSINYPNKLSVLRVTTGLLGLLLLVAALLKGLDLATDPFLGKAFIRQQLLELALIQIETLVGVGLLLGIINRVAWSVSVLFFAAGGVYSAYKLLEKADSCGCFGFVEVHPGITLSIDLVAVIVLLIAPVIDRYLGCKVKSTALRPALINALICLMFTNGVLLASAATVQGRQPLQGNRSVHNFGQMMQGERGLAEFQIMNHARYPIKVLGVRKSCSCTIVEFENRTIEPRESVLLSVEMDSTGRRGDFGSTVKLLYKVGEQQKLHNLKLGLLANVKSRFSIQPTKVFFGRQQNSTENVRLNSIPGEDVIVLDAYSTHHAFEVDLECDGQAVNIAFDSHKWHPRDSAKLVVTTNDAGQSRFDIPITVR